MILKYFKKFIKYVLEIWIVNFPIRSLIRSVLQHKIIPYELKRIIFQKITSHISLSIVDQFSIKPFTEDKIVIGKPSMSSVANQLYWMGFSSREPETTKLFYKLVKKARTIIEVGGNIGFYSLLGALANRAVEIFVFEPVPFIFEILERNISINNISNITPIRKAVSDVDEIIPFLINLDSDQSSSSMMGFRKNTKKIEVQAVTLDTFVEEENIERVDLLKLDVETSEPRVLMGMQRILRRDEPEIIC